MNERRSFLKHALLPLGALTPVGSTYAEVKNIDGDIALESQDNGPTSPLAGLGGTPLPPQEQRFTEYHLLGNADIAGNLLGGGARPKSLRETKLRLAAELAQTAKTDDPIHDWMKTFLQSFDERAAMIVLEATGSLPRLGNPTELRYEPELYDSSLRSASVQLDRCLRYRNEMGGFEISGLHGGISYLTFLKTKPIQRNLILQSSAADLDELEKLTEGRTSSIYAHAHGFNRVFEKYHLLGLRSDAEGGVAEADLAEKKDKLRTSLLERQFNIQADAQLADFTRLLSPGSASNYAERYLRLLAYLKEDLTDIYCKLYSAAKGIEQVLQINSIPMVGGVAIAMDIPQFTNPAVLASWVQQVVPTPVSSERQPDILDAFVLWSRAVMRELNRRSQYESEFTVAIPLSQPAGKRGLPILTNADMNTAFGQATPTGLVNFTLDASVLPFSNLASDLRVVGVGLSVERSQDDASPVQFVSTFANAAPKPVVSPGNTPQYDQNPPPSQVKSVRDFEAAKVGRLNATITSPRQTTPNVGTYQRPGILLSNVRIQGGVSGDLEPVLSFDSACHNLTPYGKWTIQFDPNVIEYYQSDTVINASWITGLILYFRLRGTVS